MEIEIIKQIFSEGGLVYVLFFMIVGGFIWKGVPYLFSKLEIVFNKFIETMQKQQEMCRENSLTFKESLDKISNDFVKRIEMSEHWHQEHKKDINEIKIDINTIKNNIGKQ